MHQRNETRVCPPPTRARPASLCHLGFISDPIVSKFHNETHDPKGQEIKIYTIVKGRETQSPPKIPVAFLATSVSQK